jgi:hypothetical protein
MAGGKKDNKQGKKENDKASETSSEEFPEEVELEEGEEDSGEYEEDEELYDVLVDFFANKDGENVASILTDIKNSIDKNSQCILKLAKVIQDHLGVSGSDVPAGDSSKQKNKK